ncbi:hypothetical protein CGCF415_v011862 [Colletotrichum fructicola]|uniref:Uncharacterized protein n=1 Tax=Colletotrichum fructicola (strain Nara gc5) TaxID=1213859 RepID=A0A7J6IH09_COLFN|nr:hypothetical protein CGGC5_v015745 [Colletotrichum fructicola Nara gc5]KAF4887348.1 hypothetical protein CGCFRS4_v010575 [Colletotrichum fructicola]KAF4895580.1 hypothetical protein CGCF415_v011862 [Colletotrichum fructicola]KAF4929529.1 hypothetical protein CGCF245_v012089 [Colletotrichum fructicola]KAF5486174.1 hypothetical protein CGCF413_v013389 [Colletotrichum fructicola]
MISLNRHTITASQEGALLRPQWHTSFPVGVPPSIDASSSALPCNRLQEVLDGVKEREHSQPAEYRKNFDPSLPQTQVRAATSSLLLPKPHPTASHLP